MNRMIKIIAALSLVGMISACTSAPKKADQKDLILLPADPESSLKIDEQFLQKSQKVGQITIGKPVIKTVLNP